MFNFKSNKEILEQLDQEIIGHYEAKKALINLVNRVMIRHYNIWIEGKAKNIPTSKLLLLGASGTGKTYMINVLKNIVEFPLVTINATHLTLTGASGGIKSMDLKKIINSEVGIWVERQKLKGYTNSIEGATDKVVVFVDEIDKLAWGKDEGDQWNKRTQSNFLQIFEDSEISFIFAGAFSGLKTKKSNKGIGFFKENTENFVDTEESLIEYGLIPEFVGRMTNIIQLEELNKDQYLSILNTVLLPKMETEIETFSIAMEGLNKEEIVEKALNSGQGVRCLKRSLIKYIAEQEFSYEERLYTPHEEIPKTI